jgi:hypothetical protein
MPKNKLKKFAAKHISAIFALPKRGLVTTQAFAIGLIR